MSWQVGSLVVVLLVIGIGLVWYERSRPPSQIVALVAVLAAMAVAGRVLLAPLPNVVATTDIVLFAGYALGPAPGFAVGAIGGLISNFWLGQGIWTPWQMVGWGMAGVAGWAVWKITAGRAGRLSLALACGLAGLAFGLWMNLQFLVGFGGEVTPERYLALQVRSIPFDLAHIFGNVAFALIAGPTIVAALQRFRRRFEWQRVPGTVGTFLIAISLAVVAFPPPAEASLPEDARLARSWLAGKQNRDGGFGPSPGSGSSVTITARAAIGFAAARRNPLDVRRSGNSPIGYLRAKRSKIKGPNELSLTILALHAAGVNPRNFGGRNLVSGLESAAKRDRTFGGKVNLAAWAALALRAAGGSGSRKTASRSVKWLRSVQAADGGWGVTAAAPSDPDSTGTVIQLLSPGDRADEALSFLRSAQKSSGGFGYRATVNSQSTGLVLQGLAGLGLRPSFISKSGKSGLDYLAARQERSGAVNYSKTSDQTPVWVTADALVALAGRSLPVPAPPRDRPEPQPQPGPSNGGGGSGSSATSPGTDGSGGGGSSSPGTGTGGSGDPGGDAEDSFIPGPGREAPDDLLQPEEVPPGIGPIVPPTEAVLAASGGGPGPSPGIAALVWVLVAGGVGGATVLLARRFKW